MSREKTAAPVTCRQLLAAIENTTKEAMLLVGIAVNEHEDFLKDLCLNRSQYFARAQMRTDQPLRLSGISNDSGG